MKRAYIYVRVSTARQAKEGLSLQAQEHTLREYARLNQFEVVEVIRDEGLSGRKMNRPGFQRVMQAVEKNEVDAVIVYSLSRFARNIVGMHNAMTTMDKHGVAFHSYTDRVDTSSAMGRFVLNMISAMNELESELIGERVSTAIEENKRRGKTYCRNTPFGTRADRAGKIVEDDRERKVVGKVLELRRKYCLTLRQVAEELERLGFVNRNGRVSWSHVSVLKIERQYA